MVGLIGLWQRLAPLSKRIIGLALLSSLLVPLGLWLCFQTIPSFAQTARMVVKAPGVDSWDPMSQALPTALSGTGLYQKLFFQERIKFQYPPTSLLILYPLEHEPLASCLQFFQISWLNVVHVISWLLVAATAFCVVQVFLTSAEKASVPGFAPGDRFNRTVASLLCVGLSLTFYPLIWAYTVGQIQVWINALFALLLLCWLKDRQNLAGGIAGLMCLIKPHYALLFVWGLLRRRWGFVLAGVVTGAAGLVLSIALFGLDNHLDYLNVLSFLSRRGESYFPNQSVNGLLHRALFNGDNLKFQDHIFPPYHAWVFYGTLTSSLILLAAAFFWPLPKSERGSSADLALMTLTATIASPVAWEHHYGILLPIYAFLVPWLAKTRWPLALLALSYVLTSNFLSVLNRLADTPFNVLQSYLLAGATIVLFLLYYVRGKEVRGQMSEVRG